MIDQNSNTSSLFAQDNQLFALAKLGHLHIPKFVPTSAHKWIDRWLYPALVFVFSFFTTQMAALLGFPAVLIASGVLAEDNPALFFVQLVAGFLPVFLLVWIWLNVFEGRDLWTVGLQRPFLPQYLRGLLIGLLMISAALGIFAIFGDIAIEPPSLQFSTTALAGALLLFVGWMVQGAAEEVLLRGFLFPIIGVRFGVLVSIFISSILFALLHQGNPNIGPIALLNLTLFGIFACLFALYEGGLWGICAIHAIWNWAQGNLYGLEVSGLALKGGIIFDLRETGPDWLTGGEFGPEGGLVVSAILIVSLVLVWLAQRRKTAQS